MFKKASPNGKVSPEVLHVQTLVLMKVCGPLILIGYLLFLSQLTVYLGKRDFVDHVDLVEPVGEISFYSFLVSSVCCVKE